jgi:hypothetical protein
MMYDWKNCLGCRHGAMGIRLRYKERGTEVFQTDIRLLDTEHSKEHDHFNESSTWPRSNFNFVRLEIFVNAPRSASDVAENSYTSQISETFKVTSNLVLAGAVLSQSHHSTTRLQHIQPSRSHQQRGPAPAYEGMGRRVCLPVLLL